MVHKKSERFSRVIKPGWFPFGDYAEPDSKTGLVRIKTYPEEVENIYSKPNHPTVSINAIVGKNGAGKSTLLEILYKILNNFSILAIGPIYASADGRKLVPTDSVFADLYYELDDVQYKIGCKGFDTSFFQEQEGKLKKVSVSLDNGKKVLESFFYTIVTNYSLYAFDTLNYGNGTDNSGSSVIKDSDSWISGLFHKNDGYFTPIVITPFRDEGCINIHNENHLAEQRINVLALLAEAKGSTFIPGYRPERIKMIFDENFLNYKLDSLQEEIDSHNLEWLSEDLILDAFTNAWFEVLISNVDNRFLNSNDRFISAALKYLAYKSLKLTLKYSDYRNKMRYPYRYRNYIHINKKAEYYNDVAIRDCKNLINKIFQNIDSSRRITGKNKEKQGERNHLTLKIEQTYNFIQERIKQLSSTKKAGSVNKEMSVSEFIHSDATHKIENYSDIYRILPPPFFRTSIEFKRTEAEESTNWQGISNSGSKLTLTSMSSGERHLLNCLSYVLYHIKNIESIVPDKNRIKYRHLCLVFDEIELYFHPEYQRKFINMMLEAFDWCNVSSDSIKSIQILLVTHSPFILTDIFTHNTLYLKHGERCEVKEETFVANYYDMFGNSFFFTKSAFGDIASRFISELYKKETYSDDDLRLLDFIGDEILSNYIRMKMQKGGS